MQHSAPDPDAYVREDGCVRLGKHVTCDGFSPDAVIRIQSHAHSDHLGCFPRSKGHQHKIIMTEPTKRLLTAEKHSDLAFRSEQVETMCADGKYRQVLDIGVEVALFSSAHMIGSVMASVKAEGKHYVYTGDFGSEVNSFPQNPDVLIIDATYGNPSYIREYNQSDVTDQFIETARNIMRSEPLAIIGYRGRLQRAAQILHASIPAGPFLFSPYVHRTLDIYMEYKGFTLNGHLFGAQYSRKIIASGEPYVLFVDHREGNILDQMQPIVKIELSAYMVPKEEPIIKFNEKRYRVAMTDHADFRDTILLIKKIQPKRVIADGSRNGNPVALAEYVEQELRIPATAQVFPCKPEWGFH